MVLGFRLKSNNDFSDDDSFDNFDIENKEEVEIITDVDKIKDINPKIDKLCFSKLLSI